MLKVELSHPPVSCVCVCMYVCMTTSIFMYACRYLFYDEKHLMYMYVGMFVCMYTDGFKDLNVCMYVCMCGMCIFAAITRSSNQAI